MTLKTSINIGDRTISYDSPTYFIADIAANHDGELNRAKDLIWLAKESGADCAKFQHFEAKKIVSHQGFQSLGEMNSHQSNWEASVFEVYDKFHTKRTWTEELVATCREAEIEFMTTPYDFDAIDKFSKEVRAFKVGSGDITFIPALERMAKYGKPMLVATGASNLEEVCAAVDAIAKFNDQICIMQCNTNYTGSADNFKFINLNVLLTYKQKWPGIPLGISDHTPGHSTVLGAITIGARVVEKHFTDDNSRSGPDHNFAMNPMSWRDMIERAKELEMALGDGIKRVEDNECATVQVQRRAIRAKYDLTVGTKLREQDIEFLRPCPTGCISPANLEMVIGKRLKNKKQKGEEFYCTDID